MIQKILGIFDITIGILLIIRPEFGFLKYLAYFALFKAGWSLLTSFATGWIWDWMGYIDLLGGISLILISNGHTFGLMTWFGIVLIFKGIYSSV